MRLALVVILLAACGGSPKAPAWPKDRVAETDGGHSIDPEPSAVSIEASVEDEPVVDTGDVGISIGSDKQDEPKTDTPTVTPVAPNEDLTITTEEIVIEVTPE